MDVAAANEATKEKESQLQSQSALISQLQSLHADAQNLLKKQEEQHKVQMEGVKKSQKKLILFCQKGNNFVSTIEKFTGCCVIHDRFEKTVHTYSLAKTLVLPNSSFSNWMHALLT